MQIVTIALLIVFLTSCGPPPDPSVDISVSAAPVLAYPGSTVVLTGVTVGQHGAQIFDTQWAQESGPAAVSLIRFFDPGQAQGVCTTPGTYVFRYIVKWHGDGYWTPMSYDYGYYGPGYNSDHIESRTVTIQILTLTNG